MKKTMNLMTILIKWKKPVNQWNWQFKIGDLLKGDDTIN